MADDPWGPGVTGSIHPMRVKCQFRMGTTVAQFGFHLRDQSLTGNNPQDAAEDVATWFQTNVRALLYPTDQLIGVDVVDMLDASGGSVSFSNLNGTMSNTDTVEASFIAATVSLKSGIRKRYGQGRFFFPIRTEQLKDGDLLSTAGRAAIQAVVDSWVTRYVSDAGTYRAINVHGTLPPLAATEDRPARAEIPPHWYDVQSARLNTAVTALHSRKQGVGS